MLGINVLFLHLNIHSRRINTLFWFHSAPFQPVKAPNQSEADNPKNEKATGPIRRDKNHIKRFELFISTIIVYCTSAEAFGSKGFILTASENRYG